MKQFFFCVTLMLTVIAHAAAQTQTRNQSSVDSEPSRSESTTAIRSRIVGPKVENHAEKPTTQRQSSEPTAKLIQPTAIITKSPVPLNTAPVRTTTSASVVPAPLPSTSELYRVGAGDVLDIRLSNMPTRESTLFTVMKDGSLEFPLIANSVTVAGLTTDEIARLLRREIKVISNPRTSVTVRDYASHRVMVTGLVDNAGRKFLRREAMPLYAVIAEALPRPEGSIATIARGGKTASFSMNDTHAMSALVYPGDVIKISSDGAAPKRFVYVGGNVAAPGEREFREGMTLTQALLSAGGVSRSGRGSVRIARRNQGGFLVTNEYNLRSIEEGKSPDPFIEAGDRIEVTGGM